MLNNAPPSRQRVYCWYIAHRIYVYYMYLLPILLNTFRRILNTASNSRTWRRCRVLNLTVSRPFSNRCVPILIARARSFFPSIFSHGVRSLSVVVMSTGVNTCTYVYFVWIFSIPIVIECKNRLHIDAMRSVFQTHRSARHTSYVYVYDIYKHMRSDGMRCRTNLPCDRSDIV